MNMLELLIKHYMYIQLQFSSCAMIENIEKEQPALDP